MCIYIKPSGNKLFAPIPENVLKDNRIEAIALFHS